jgi:hypothetical protein
MMNAPETSANAIVDTGKRLQQAYATPELFDLLGTRASLGRTFFEFESEELRVQSRSSAIIYGENTLTVPST